MKFSALLLLLVAQWSFGQNYLWPTNASNYLTSSFCEYRSGHFHSAIDIKTWNREGYDCYAIEDGTISRIRVSPFGYGKVLYLKLNDGRTAVYAHLQKFTPELEKAIRERQIAEERYSIDWWPGIKVKKGEVIAYTGQTGIGVPHLHFEIRDSENRPLNPLAFYEKIKDNLAPELRKLLVIPLNEKARVNNDLMPLEIDLPRSRNNLITLDKPIHAYGRLGFAIEGYDQANEVHNKLGFYSLSMSVNGNERFSMRYDQMRFSHTHLINRHIFYPWKTRTGRRYTKLYREPETDLLAYASSPADGILTYSGDSSYVEIKVGDFFGNYTTLRFKVVSKAPSSRLAIEQSEQLNGNAYLRMRLPAEMAGLQFYSGRDPNQLNPVDYYEFIDWNHGKEESSALLKVKLRDSGDPFLKAVARDKSGWESDVLTTLNNTIGEPHFIEPLLWGKYIYVKTDRFSGDGQAKLVFHGAGGQREAAIEGSYPDLYGFLPASQAVDGPVRISLEKSGEVLADTLLNSRLVFPDHSGVADVFDGSLRLEWPAGSVYDTMFIAINEQSSEGIDWEAPVNGLLYDIRPTDRLLRESFTLRLRLGDSTFHKQAAIYRASSDGKLSFDGGSRQNGFIETRIRSFGRYIIAADTAKPDIRLLSTQLLKPVRNVGNIRFAVKDGLSGFNGDRDIRITINDRFVVSEWDPERDIVSATPHFVLEPGSHSLHIEVQDRSGNRLEKTYTIRVTP